jgi:hypothetical protein
VDVFCIYIGKQKNETDWNCSKKGEKDIREDNEGVDLNKMYYKHICKYNNASSCKTIIC